MNASSVHDDSQASAHVAHLHLLSVVNTESYRFPTGETVRILDAGCGAGHLIAFLADKLPRLRPGLTFELYGFDVTDRPSENFGEAVQELARRAPGTPWEERLIRIPAETVWPYPEGFFDMVISNQVGEHLRSRSFFRRVREMPERERVLGQSLSADACHPGVARPHPLRAPHQELRRAHGLYRLCRPGAIHGSEKT